MTPEFEAVLNQRTNFKAWFLVLQIALPSLVLLFTLPKKYYWLSIISLIGCIFVSQAIVSHYFDKWWSTLESTAKAEADLQWIRDHDGGRLIFYVSSFIRACFFSVCAGIVTILMWRKSKNITNQNED